MEEVEELAKNIDEIKASLEKLEKKEKPANTWPHNASATLAIKPFSGDPNDPWANIEEFETQFKLVANALSWSESQQVAMLPLYLTGHAKEKYYTLDDADKESSESLWHQLRRTFRTPGMDSFIGMQLRSRTQGPTETVAEFIADIKKLSRLAFTDQPDATKETLAREAFIAGLRPNLKMIVLRSGTTDLEEAVSLAYKEELTQKVMQADAKRGRESEIATLATSVDKLIATLQITNKPQTSQRFQYNPRPMAEWTTAGLPRCYNCGRRGHIARLCRQQNFARTPQNNNHNFNRQYQNTRPQNRFDR